MAAVFVWKSLKLPSFGYPFLCKKWYNCIDIQRRKGFYDRIFIGLPVDQVFKVKI